MVGSESRLGRIPDVPMRVTRPRRIMTFLTGGSEFGDYCGILVALFFYTHLSSSSLFYHFPRLQSSGCAPTVGFISVVWAADAMNSFQDGISCLRVSPKTKKTRICRLFKIMISHVQRSNVLGEFLANLYTYAPIASRCSSMYLPPSKHLNAAAEEPPRQTPDARRHPYPCLPSLPRPNPQPYMYLPHTSPPATSKLPNHLHPSATLPKSPRAALTTPLCPSALLRPKNSTKKT